MDQFVQYGIVFTSLLDYKTVRTRILLVILIYRPWTFPSGHLRVALQQAEEVPVPKEDAWRVLYTWQLLEQRLQHYYTGNTEEEEQVQSLLDSLVKN